MKSVFLVCFGTSLFNVFYPWEQYLPFAITAADFTVMFVCVFLVIKYRSISFSFLSIAMIFFSVCVFCSGLINIVFDPTFYPTNFLVNYIRLIGLSILLIFMPRLISDVEPLKIIKACVWTIRIHCFAVLVGFLFFENMGVQLGLFPPVPENFWRTSSGMFGEPGWFGIWLGLILLVVFQYQRNFDIKVLRWYDYLSIFLALFISTSIRGFILVAVAFTLYGLFKEGLIVRRLVYLAASLSVGALGIWYGGTLILNSDQDASSRNVVKLLSYNAERLGSIFGETNRFSGSKIIYDLVTEEYPWGIGLGQDNQDRFANDLSGYRWLDERGRRIKIGATTMYAAFGAAAGYIGVLVLIIVQALMVFLRETRLFGLGFIILSIIWGGAFLAMIWWLVGLVCFGTIQKIRKPERI